MTTDQIRRVWFGGRKWRVYDRLKALRQAGYLTALAYMDGGIPRGWCYYVTEKAAVELGLNRPERVSRFVDPARQNYRVALAEIVVRLYGTGWTWTPAGRARRRFGLNPNAELDGVLRNPQGLLLAVYLIGPNPREAKVRAVRAEIRAHQDLARPLSGAVLLFASREVMDRFGSDALGAYRLMRLPYPDGLDVLARLADPAAPLELVPAELGGFSAALPDEPWADWLLKGPKGEAYLVELLTNDAAKLRGLLSYTVEVARARRRPVVVLAFEDEMEAFSRLAGRPHVRPVAVPRAWTAGKSREKAPQAAEAVPQV